MAKSTYLSELAFQKLAGLSSQFLFSLLMRIQDRVFTPKGPGILISPICEELGYALVDLDKISADDGVGRTQQMFCIHVLSIHDTECNCVEKLSHPSEVQLTGLFM